MNKLLIVFLLISYFSFSQETIKTLDKDETKTIIGNEICECVTKIETQGKSTENIHRELDKCIKEKVVSYQMILKIINQMKESNFDEALEKSIKSGKTVDTIKTKESSISINTNEKSIEYQKYYSVLEEELKENCPDYVMKLKSNEQSSSKSFTQNSEAIKLYNKGLDLMKVKNYKNAVKQFKKAVKLDDQFAFAWDNIGVCERNLGNYEAALKAYNTSLKIDPKGALPLQNIPVVYLYMNKYKKAIEAYKNLDKIYPGNVEVYYGIGSINILNLDNYEEGLDYMCKAYVKYNEQNSPFKSDAIKLIKIAYDKLKEQNKLDTFNSIIEKNGISLAKE